jgi:hypothetical protein
LAAPSDEYLDYRAVRVADKLEPRLQASETYLQKHPRGRWRDDVRPWFQRAEFRYWDSRKDTIAGLSSYLKLLPDGPHSQEARQQLSLLTRLLRLSQVEGIALEARYTEERLAARARERETARDAFASWLGRFLSIETWGQRTSNLSSDLIFDWRIEKPQAHCIDDHCSKLIQLPFSMPGGGPEAARELTLDAKLQLRQGMVYQGRLEGPELFSRVYETSTGRPVRPDDPASRVQAIAFAVDVVKGAAEARLPASSCEKEAIAPVVLVRNCNGWTLTMTAADQPSDDDTVVIEGPQAR